jgi:gliding motility-associated lipoprotein GldH
MRKLILLLLLCGLFACNDNEVYKMRSDIPDLSWYRANKLVFTPHITDTASRYNMTLLLRHSNAYPYTNLIFTLRAVLPSGSFTTKNYNIALRDSANNFLGDGAGDIWDFEAPLEKNFRFWETGVYVIELEQGLDVDPAPMLMEVGILIDKADPE